MGVSKGFSWVLIGAGLGVAVFQFQLRAGSLPEVGPSLYFLLGGGALGYVAGFFVGRSSK